MNVSTRVTAAAILLGLGLGGFFDGVVFHQLLGWHHMICRTDHCRSTSVEDLQFKNFTDGCFHAGCWVLCAAGLGVLATARPGADAPFGRRLIGWAVAGSGLFNLIEGLIDHIILGVHHVKPGPTQVWWDVGFLIWGRRLRWAGG